VVTVRDAPKSVNQGGGGTRANPFAAAKEKKEWEGRFFLELLQAKERRNMKFCRIKVEVRYKHKNRRDEENLRQPVIKPLLDAMVKGNYLPDDTPEYVKVEDFRLAYPEVWVHKDPRLKAEMVLYLEAEYAD
jgi:hypothetical protein